MFWGWNNNELCLYCTFQTVLFNINSFQKRKTHRAVQTEQRLLTIKTKIYLMKNKRQWIYIINIKWTIYKYNKESALTCTWYSKKIILKVVQFAIISFRKPTDLPSTVTVWTGSAALFQVQRAKLVAFTGAPCWEFFTFSWLMDHLPQTKCLLF